MSKEKPVEIYNPNVAQREKEWRRILANYGLELSNKPPKPVSVREIEEMAYPRKPKG